MKKSIQIQIPEPCYENWDKMTAANQGRFCSSCSKVVVDFSMMSDKEILNHISKAGSSICGRVSDDQLNRPIQMSVERKQISFKYLWSLLVSSFLIGYKANAQGKMKVETIENNASSRLMGDTGMVIAGQMSVARDNDDFFAGRKVIKGQITDEAGIPIAAASVKIENSEYGTVADSKGRFRFNIPASINRIKLTVSSIGYETVSLDLDDENQKSLNIVMKSSHTELLDEVVVVGYTPTRCNRTSGAMMMVTTVTYQNKIIDTLQQFIGKNKIKVYPNPVSAGTAFNISFSVIETGNYRLELYDAAGRMMHSSTVPVFSKKQVMNFGGGLSLTPGIYFVKILSAKGKNMYSGSLLVQ